MICIERERETGLFDIETLWLVTAPVVPALLGLGYFLTRAADPYLEIGARLSFALAGTWLGVVGFMWPVHTPAILPYRIAAGLGIGTVVFVVVPMLIRLSWAPAEAQMLPPGQAAAVNQGPGSAYSSGQQGGVTIGTLYQAAPREAGVGPILSPPQERFLGLVANYQRQFASTKLIIGRKDGQLYFDGDIDKGKNVNLFTELYGLVDTSSQTKFEALVESVPSDYLRILPEMRWDNPFVVSITDAGLTYLRHQNLSESSALEDPNTELNRRKSLLGRLRQEYILSHDGISPALAAGTELVPSDWMNGRLEQMNEKWRVRAMGSNYEMVNMK